MCHKNCFRIPFYSTHSSHRAIIQIMCDFFKFSLSHTNILKSICVPLQSIGMPIRRWNTIRWYDYIYDNRTTTKKTELADGILCLTELADDCDDDEYLSAMATTTHACILFLILLLLFVVHNLMIFR